MKIIEQQSGLYFLETVDGDSVTRSMPFTKTQTKTVMVDGEEQELCIYDDLIDQGYTLVSLSDEVKAQFEADNAAQQLKLDNKPHLDYLAETDWYIARLIDTGKAIPDDVATQRQAAREAVSHV